MLVSFRNKMITGIEVAEQHFYLKSLSAGLGKIIFYNSMEECPIEDGFGGFNQIIEIEEVQYKLRADFSLSSCKRVS